VDKRYTNCDVARQLAPGLIGEVDGRSAIIRQPRDEAEVATVHAAATPTGSGLGSGYTRAISRRPRTPTGYCAAPNRSKSRTT